MAIEYLDNGNVDGTVLGQAATTLVGFYGATPVVQPTQTETALTAIATTTISQVATSGKWAFATSTAAKALVTRVSQLQVDLKATLAKLETLGLIAVAGN